MANGVGWPGGLPIDRGTLTASYATGTVNGGVGDVDHVGGLVGVMCGSGTRITASYATGDSEWRGIVVDNSHVGGLVGWQQEAPSPPATPPAQWMAGLELSDAVGGLVGRMSGGTSHRQLRLWYPPVVKPQGETTGDSISMDPEYWLHEANPSPVV